MPLKSVTTIKDSFFASVGQLMGARAFLMLFQFLSLPILARLLTIEDFAIVALGMAIPMFANTFSDAGFGKSLIRAPLYNATEWSTVFWFLAALGVFLAVVVALIAPFYAGIMDQAELFPVVLVLGLIPMMQSLISVHQASLERAFRFRAMSSVLAFGGVFSIAVAVTMAYFGFGYWALVAQQVLLVAVRMVGVFWFSSFRPTMVFRADLLRPHLKFGTNTLLFSGVMTVQNQAPVIAFNQVFGTLAVSLWSMTERVSRLPRLGMIGPLSQVAMVSMSRQWRDGAGARDVGTSYIAAIRLLTALLFPGMLVLAVNGRPVFTWFLSEPWGDIALLFGLAAPGFLVDMIASLGARVFMVADRTDLRLRMSIERFLIGIALFLAALPFGLEIAILVRSAFAVAYLPRYWSYLNICVPLNIQTEIMPLLLPTCAGLVVGVLCTFLIAPLGSSTAIQALIVVSLCMLASGLTVLVSWPKLRADITWLRNSANKPEGSNELHDEG